MKHLLLRTTSRAFSKLARLFFNLYERTLNISDRAFYASTNDHTEETEYEFKPF